MPSKKVDKKDLLDWIANVGQAMGIDPMSLFKGREFLDDFVDVEIQKMKDDTEKRMAEEAINKKIEIIEAEEKRKAEEANRKAKTIEKEFFDKYVGLTSSQAVFTTSSYPQRREPIEDVFYPTARSREKIVEEVETIKVRKLKHRRKFDFDD